MRFTTGLAMGTAAGYLFGRRRNRASTAGTDQRQERLPASDIQRERSSDEAQDAPAEARKALAARGRSEAGARAHIDGNGPMDVLALLDGQHMWLLDAVAEARATDPEKPHDARELRAKVQRIVTEASRHELLEEKHLWPVVRTRVRDGQHIVDQACEDELEMKRLLHDLDTRHPGDIDFDDLLETFETLAARHIRFETEQIWPLVDWILTEKERQELSDAVEVSAPSLPTRPHASVWADPVRHPALSRAVAIVDRGVDKVAARGRGPYSS